MYSILSEKNEHCFKDTKEMKYQIPFLKDGLLLELKAETS